MRGEEVGVGELLGFVAEADEVGGDGGAGLVGVEREWWPAAALALREGAEA